jgi:hypothetical protein
MKRVALVIAVVAAFAGRSSANLVTNPGFESGTLVGSWTQSGNLGFTSVANSAPFVHSGTFGLEMGPVGSLGFITQTLATQVGTTYDLSYWFLSGPFHK